MPLDISAVQDALVRDRLDGWLLYDFKGLNPIAARLAGTADRHTTRRWYYFIPARGAPTKLVHAIESFVLDGLPGTLMTYAGRQALEERVEGMLASTRTVAMEYSPECAIPSLSRVDAGTLEFLRRIGLTVVSSGDLVGRFEAAWDEAALTTHREAAVRLYRIKDRTFEYVRSRLAAGESPAEIEIQDQMVEWFRTEGLVTDARPIVAVGANAGNPHYEPSAGRPTRLERDQVLLLNLWGKLDKPGAVYADITWMGFSGTPPDAVAGVLATAISARDAAISLVEARVRSGAAVRGFEVDRAARAVVEAAGLGTAFVHRTGHSLGQEVHGTGVNMDDYETHDDRRLVPGTGFTIEPGIYLPTVGVRTEVNVFVGRESVEVTGPRQEAFVPLT